MRKPLHRGIAFQIGSINLGPPAHRQARNVDLVGGRPPTTVSSPPAAVGTVPVVTVPAGGIVTDTTTGVSVGSTQGGYQPAGGGGRYTQF